MSRDGALEIHMVSPYGDPGARIHMVLCFVNSEL